MRKDSNRVTLRTVPLRLLGCLLAVVLVASGCDTASDEDESPQGVEIEAGLPGAYADRGTWKTEINPDIAPIVTPYGIVAVIPSLDDDPVNTYRIVLLNHDDGGIRWRSAPVASVRDPALWFTKVKGDPWVVVRAFDPAADSLLTFDVLGVGDQAVPTAALALRPAGKRPVAVTVSTGGIMISGADDPAGYVQVHPDSGATTAFGKPPTSRTGPGVPVLVRENSWLIAYPKRGFAVASARGGWESRAVAPDGVGPRSGLLVAHGPAVVVALWGKADQQVVAVHSLLDGRVLAQQPAAADAREYLAHQSVVASPDANWVFVGEYAFNTKTGEAKRLALNEGTPVSYSRGVLYVRGASAPLPIPMPPEEPSAEPSASPSDTESPSDAASDVDPSASASTSVKQPDTPTGFTGLVAVDVETLNPLEGEITAVPIGTSALGEGIFVQGSSVLSVPLR